MSACARSRSKKYMRRSPKCWPLPAPQPGAVRSAPVMTVTATARASRNEFERVFAALTDPAKSERTMLGLLASYAAVWSLYGAIAKAIQDLQFHIGEMFAWSHQVGWSAPTHPPLGAWLTRVWFAVMPRQDW